MICRKLLAFIFFSFAFQFSQAQSSDSIKQLVIDEFKREHGEIRLNAMWKTNFGLDYDEIYAVFNIKSFQGKYWIIEYSDTRNPTPDIAITVPYLSDIARPDEVTDIETITPGYSMEQKIEAIDTCQELEKNLPIIDAPKDATFSCVRMVTEEELKARQENRENPEAAEAARKALEAIKKIEREKQIQ